MYNPESADTQSPAFTVHGPRSTVHTASWQPQLGAVHLGEDRSRFRVWAPRAGTVEVHLVEPHDRHVPLAATGNGYHEATVDAAPPGSLYFYRLDGEKERPDPVSRHQPRGVHGPSEVVARDFPWTDQDWFGLSLQEYVVYELHVGTFTPEGTFEAIIPRLDDLKSLGITAIELMPVAQFPGERNWGYDGVALHAAQHSYGGPVGLKRLVDACHQKGLAVVLDVVYNHLGPEGNYLWDYGYYFTDGYKTPWGDAVNFDGPHSDEVRRFFTENALGWLTDFHIDALRLDAVHAIKDFSAIPFLEELAVAAGEQARLLGRRFHLIAESDLNDVRVIKPRELGGFGLDAQWSDNFHHSLRTLLTGDLTGYYEDFGKVEHLARTFRTGFCYEGDYSVHRRCRYGNSARGRPAWQFVVFSQNHDQVGNRMMGERLGAHLDQEGLKVAAATVLLSPFLPMLFMGEEYGETAPFPFFSSHGDAGLIEAVRKGRREEFASFDWRGEPPDPQDEGTFRSAKLNHALRGEPRHGALWSFYQELLRLRRTLPTLARLDNRDMDIQGFEKQQCLSWRRWDGDDQVLCLLNFSDRNASLRLQCPRGTWTQLLDSSDTRWMGPGSAHPPTFASDGEVEMGLSRRVCVLYGKTRERR